MNPVVIGKRLRELRGNTRLEVVCAACNCSVSSMSQYESGVRIPRDSVKIKLANLYHKTVQELFFDP